jgi:hypothetical protein
MSVQTTRLKEKGLSRDGEFVLQIGTDEIQDVAIQLMMLLWGIKSAVVFSDGSSLFVKVLKGVDSASVAQVRSSPGKLEFVLGSNQVEYFLATLLRAIANGGAATASHIHIEGVMRGNPYDLTVLFEHFQPPLSPDEAEKELNR